MLRCSFARRGEEVRLSTRLERSFEFRAESAWEIIELMRRAAGSRRIIITRRMQRMAEKFGRITFVNLL